MIAFLGKPSRHRYTAQRFVCLRSSLRSLLRALEKVRAIIRTTHNLSQARKKVISTGRHLLVASVEGNSADWFIFSK